MALTFEFLKSELLKSERISYSEACKACDADDELDDRLQNLLAVLAHGEKNLPAALSHSKKAVQLRGTADNFANHGAMQLAAGNLDVAQTALKSALDQDPNHFHALFNFAEVLRKRGDRVASYKIYSQLQQTHPSNTEVLFKLANFENEAGKPDIAEELFRKILTTQPRHFDALHNLGVALYNQRRFEEAIETFFEALELNCSVSVMTNIIRTGIFLHEEKKVIALIDAMLERMADNPAFLTAAGVFFSKKRHVNSAIHYLEKALEIDPSNLEAAISIGQLFKSLGNYERAEKIYRDAFEHHPKSPDLHNCQANLLKERNSYEKAIEHFNLAMSLGGENKAHFSELLASKFSICDWEDTSNVAKRLLERIYRNNEADSPFPLTAFSDDALVHLYNAQLYFAKQNTCVIAGNVSGQDHTRKLNSQANLAYFSADFRNHPVSQLAVGLIEQHDRSRFRVIGFYYGPAIKDAMRQRVESAFDVFHDIRGMSDEDVLKLARDEGLDIAIDLSGYTFGARTSLFAKRLAPTQINYLGYPGTMGSTCYDYIVVDDVIAPKGHEKYYSEKLLRLSGCYQPNDKSRRVADTAPTRTELGLPEDDFVFCCFNNNYKILPETFASWMRILKECPKSVLWLLQDNPTAAKNLKGHAKEHGINPARLYFAPRCASDLHLARQKRADLFLDTFPYNAHTTASDALWVGLPVLTLMGESFASRVAASILTAAGLQEFITNTRENYEKKAIDLYNKTVKSSQPILNQTQLNQIQNSSLFNISAYAKSFEQKLRQNNLNE
jgi:protein O-GlcNAc transferase